MKTGKNSEKVRLKLIRTAALLVWAVMAMAHSLGRAQQSSEPKRALVLYWYNKDHPWNVKFDQSFQAALQSVPAGTVEYYPEYLETNRFPGEKQALLLRDYLRQKYADRTIDVVVANIESPEIFTMIARSTPVPIYGMSYPILGNGIVGGYIITSEATGTKVAEIALLIANGARAQEIPVESAPTVPMFDLRQLRRWGISEDRLPPGSIVRFKESTFWGQYKQRVIGVSALFVVQTLLIAVLLLERARRQRATYELRESEERFSKAFHSSPQPMSITSLDEGRYLDVNERFLEVSGYTREEVIGRTSLELNIWESLEARAELIGTLKGRGAVRNLETKFGTKGAGFRILLSSAEMIELGGQPRVLVASSDITERKRVEEALRESEARFRNMADNAPLMVWMSDAEGAGIYGSPSWYEFTGQTPESALGSGWVAALHPDDRELSENIFLAANEKHEAFRLEYRLLRNDGEYRWAIDSARPRFDSQGEFLGYIGSVVDITETKQAELNTQFINQLDFDLSQIADADEIIRLATGRLGEYLGVTSCYVIEVNPAADLAIIPASPQSWRHDGESIVGEYRISDFTTPEFREMLEAGHAAIVNDVMTDPRTRDFAAKYEAFGVGAFITIPALNERQWEASLNVNHPQARDWRPDETQLMRDMTARLWPAVKRARAVKALRESEERYRSVVESQTELICRYLPDTTLTFVNDAYCRYFGKKQEELIGVKFLDFIPEPAREVARKHIESLVENPRVEIDEHEVLLPNGAIGWQQWIDHAILDASGKVVEFQAVGRDITELKEVEQERREGEERLRLALEAGRMGVWEWDVENDALEWSKEHYKIMGLEPFSVAPKNYGAWADRVHPDDLQVTVEAIRRAIEEKREYRCE